MTHILDRVKKTRLAKGLADTARWVGKCLPVFFRDRVRTGERIEAALDGVSHEKRAKAAKDYADTAVTLNTLDGRTRQENALAEKMENAAADSWVDLYLKCEASGLKLEHDCYGKPLIYKLLPDGTQKVITGFMSTPRLPEVEDSVTPTTRLIA